jgi:hypothetical protein
MIRTLKQLVIAAKNAGMTVTDRSIIKNRNTGIYWYQDGSIYMAGVDLGIAKQMRVKDAVQFLGLQRAATAKERLCTPVTIEQAGALVANT